MKRVLQINKLLFGLLFMGALFTACSADEGEDGMIGPVGPQGEMGIEGPQGENGLDGMDGMNGEDGMDGENGEDGMDGENGEDGEDGSTEVIYSEWIPSGFDDPITDDFDQFELDVPQLNEVLQDSGIILVYARVGTLIYPIPVTFFGTLDENYNWRLLTTNDDFIAVRVNSTDGSVIGSPFLNGEYRYILIPGSIPADTGGGSTLSAQEYQNMSYEEVAQLFDIRD